MKLAHLVLILPLVAGCATDAAAGYRGDRDRYYADARVTHPDETPRWNKFQWVGDQGQGISTRWRQPAEMPEGEGGFSGFRHSPGGQHWAGSR